MENREGHGGRGAVDPPARAASAIWALAWPWHGLANGKYRGRGQIENLQIPLASLGVFDRGSLRWDASQPQLLLSMASPRKVRPNTVWSPPCPLPAHLYPCFTHLVFHALFFSMSPRSLWVLGLAFVPLLSALAPCTPQSVRQSDAARLLPFGCCGIMRAIWAIQKPSDHEAQPRIRGAQQDSQHLCI